MLTVKNGHLIVLGVRYEVFSARIVVDDVMNH